LAPGASGTPGRLTVGLVRGLRGLRGHVRVELLTDRPEERFTVGAVLYPEGAARGLTIAEASAVADGPGWWLRFAEVPSREAAEGLRDLYLEIDLPDEPREPGRWFWHELEGLAVRGSDGTELGTVTDIYRAGGAEVFVVRGPRGELDVPGVKGIVVDLAPERGEMIVDMEALALDARPVDDEEYVRPRDRRPANPRRPKAPKPAPPSTALREATPADAGRGGKASVKGAKAPAKGRKGGDAGSRTLTPEEIEAARGQARTPEPGTGGG
jgi:16S rRNA processing protein RimM